MIYYNTLHKGWSRGRASHTFREKFGHWPNGLKDLPVMPNREVEGYIRSRMIAYIKGRRR